jgi:general secretion pathway protein A
MAKIERTELYYNRQFGLSNPPFEMVSKPNSLFMSKAHREGLAALEWGLLYEPGHFTLLIGEAGTGKTTLINVLLNRHFQLVANADGQAIYSSRTSDLVRIAYLTNSKIGFEEMLWVILEQLGYPSGLTTKAELLRKFERLFRQLRPKERIVIIVDEAQALSNQTLEEIRLFSNYGEYGKGHLEILLIGQPELLTRLMEPSLRQFHQRIGARAILNPLQREEAFEYIDHKLRESGGSTKEIFGKRAVEMLVDHSQGIPRQLNLLCNNALIRAYGSDLRFVTAKFAREAISEFENLAGTEERFRAPIGRWTLHSIVSHSAIPTGFSLIALIGLYFLMVTLPERRPFIPEVANTDVTPHPETDVIDTGRNAAQVIDASDGSIVGPALGSSSANSQLAISAPDPANSEAAKRASSGSIVMQRFASAQESGAASTALASISNAIAADAAAAFRSQNTSLPASAFPTIIEGHGKSPPAAPAHHLRSRHKAPRKARNRVIQSRVQLALQSDPRFKKVGATATQPGVIVLEGQVLDNEAKALAEQTVAAVSGVKRVINALTTNSLQWLLLQNRINQALQQNGFPLVSVKVIVKTASISGQVSNEADRDRAVMLVNATAPDVTIGTNLINVVSSGL